MASTISGIVQGYGILLDSSGLGSPVTNFATIDFSAGYQGILAGQPWAIDNHGLIEAAAPDERNVGVLVAAPGSVTNFPGATIDAGVGVVIEGFSATVRNGGVIAGGFGAGVHLLHGGTVFNAIGAKVKGETHAVVVDGAAGTITNGGVMTAGGAGGVVLRAGGRIANTGTLSAASYAVTVSGGAGTVVNEGTITAGQVAVALAGGGSVQNFGVLAAGSGPAVSLAAGSTIYNFGVVFSGDVAVGSAGAALVENADDVESNTGPAVSLGAGGTVVNDGEIMSTLGVAVTVTGGGTVETGGVISGAAGGIVFSGGAGTVVDGGTIMAGSGAPISFASGYANVLVVGGDSAVGGTVDGGNPIGGLVASTLVLGDAGVVVPTMTAPVYQTSFYEGADGSDFTVGIWGGWPPLPTFSGLGTRFTNFATIANETAWQFNGSDAVPDGVTLVNAGTIGGSGVTLGRGSVLVNAVSGGASIDGLAGIRYGFVGDPYFITMSAPPSQAVYAGTASSGVTIVNDLGIYDRQGAGSGIVLLAGGTITNASGIYGDATGISLAGPGLIVNDGATTRVNDGVTYQAVGSIAGTVGVAASGPTTIDNAGTISGSSAAVLLAPGYADLVVVRPGAVFQGLVDGGNAVGAGAVSTLELAAGEGTLAGLGTQFTDFGDIAVDAGSTWTLSGGGAPGGARLDVAGTLVLGGSLAGGGAIELRPGGELVFAPGELPQGITIGAGGTIEVLGAAETIVGYGGGALTLDGAMGITLDVAGSRQFAVSQANGNSYVTACFAGGTGILTAAGRCRVEALRPGMRVLTASGRLAAIRWIGRRRLAPARHPRPWDVMPVRVRAGAFGEGLPSRDLLLSPDHAVLARGALIPVRYLLNGDTIAQEARERVTYWHVELDRHDVLLAEDLACESYLDTGNRDAFEGGAATALHPVFATGEGCLPLVLDAGDARMVAARAALLARAAPLTREAAIGLAVGGATLRPRHEAGALRFDLPAGCGCCTLTSRVHVPAHVLADSNDTRLLGVAVAAIRLDGRPLSLHALNEGWHAAEPGHRWTDGAGVIPLHGARRLEVVAGPPGTYRITARAAARRRRCPRRAAAGA